jgi:hypothetical protein
LEFDLLVISSLYLKGELSLDINVMLWLLKMALHLDPKLHISLAGGVVRVDALIGDLAMVGGDLDGRGFQALADLSKQELIRHPSLLKEVRENDLVLDAADNDRAKGGKVLGLGAIGEGDLLVGGAV